MIVQGDNRHGPPDTFALPTPGMRLAPAAFNMQYTKDREQIAPFSNGGNSNGNVGHVTTNGNGAGEGNLRGVTRHLDGSASLHVSAEFFQWAMSRKKTRQAIEQVLREKFRDGWPKYHRGIAAATGKEIN
jgi:hypothetical protein